MALIKHNHAVDIAKSAVVLDLGDLQRQGQLMTQAARDQAAAIIADAKAERARILQGAAEEGRKQGFEQGHAAGLAAGTEEGRKAAIAEMGPQLQKLENACLASLGAFESSRVSMIYAAERDLLRLAIRLAERIVKRRIAADPQVVVDQFRAVLDNIARPTALIIRVHPEDARILREALPQFASQAGSAKHVEVIEDPSLDRGSCIASMRGAAEPPSWQGIVPDQPSDAAKPSPGPSVTSGAAGGEIDASIATQLERLTEALLPGDQPLHT